jgi:hypothetical protein
MRRGCSALIVLTSLACVASGAVFQYRVAATTERGDSAAFLWIPPKARQVRGLVVAGMTLMEREFAKDAQIRRACAEQQLAVVFLDSGLGRCDLPKVLANLAEVSGYRELPVAPLMFVGHSAGGPQAKALAVKMADRCFGLVQYRGGGPGDAPPVPPGVATLMMVGQFDEFGGAMRREDGRESWQGARDHVAAYRGRNAGNLASIVVEPGAGHFAWSDRNAAYLALWIRKAARARIPATWPIGAAEPVALKSIDPRGGWLTDLTIHSAGPAGPAAWAQYRGEKSKAAWHFDKEMAEATVAYHAGGFGRKDQFIRWNDPYWVDAGARFFFTRIQWVGDGQTFEVHPAYADKYPSQHKGRGPRWPMAGKPVGRAKAPIRVRHVSGPVAAAGANRFHMRYDALTPAGARSRVTFLACSAGDAEHRYTEQVGMLPRGFRGLTKGKAQTVTFPPIGKVTAGTGPVELRAISDAGLPVEYYVAYGPAAISGGKLYICEIPARAKWPIAVEVVACQFGRGVEPLVKTATPVPRAIRIEKPSPGTAGAIDPANE